MINFFTIVYFTVQLLTKILWKEKSFFSEHLQQLLDYTVKSHKKYCMSSGRFNKTADWHCLLCHSPEFYRKQKKHYSKADFRGDDEE